MKKPHQKAILQTPSAEYGGLIGGIADLLEAARRTAARTINALMTATYWEIGRRIVEFEQGGEKRAEYGEGLMARLADDLTARFGRGFSRQNLQRFRLFYLSQPAEKICSTLSSKLNGGIGSEKSAPHFQRSAFLSRSECAIQSQQSPDRPRRSPAPYIQSRPRQLRPSSHPRTRSTCSRSTGNGSPRIVGRRTLSDAAQD
jgi:hypothetical protein